MAINLLSIKPNKVSADLSSYVTYIFGYPKGGKTTLASQFPSPLFIATEKGYLTIPGVMAQDVTSWSEIKQVIRELKKKDVREQLGVKSIVIDTVDLAATMCEKYVCAQAGVDSIGAIPFGGGWTKLKKEWEQTFLEVRNIGLALVFISHSKDKVFTRKDGSQYNQIVASCPTTYNDIIKGMSDIIGYIDIVNGQRVLTLRSPDNSIDVGCRFKEIENQIPLGYENLVNAITKAIERESAATNGKYITQDRAELSIEKKYDYEGMRKEFGEIVNNLMNKDQSKYSPQIVAITNKVLGKDKKFNDCTPEQVELMDLVIQELKELV